MAAKDVFDEGAALNAGVVLRWARAAGVVLALGPAACAGHSEYTLPVRTALDAGDTRGAIRLLDERMKVSAEGDLPADMGSDNALYVLDRGTLQQSILAFDRSKRDLEAADKAIDMLDLSRGAGDSIGEYVFSGSSGRYRAPPYEKLLVNTLDMLNYLELRDLDGARVEARRLAVMQRYIADDLEEGDNAVLGLGGLLAGLVFEKSDQVDEALRWYDQTLAFAGFRALQDPVRSLLPRGHYRSPRLEAIEKSAATTPAAPPDTGEILVVVGYGRVPHKIAHRVPIGLALTWEAGAMSPHDVELANRMAAQGLVTWVNFPTLGREQGAYELPSCTLDGQPLALDLAVDVTHQVRGEWKKIEGKIIVSAITRLLARYAAGTLAGAAAGSDKLLAAVLSIGTQATLAALDVPDTRSWETLPARVAVARVRVPAGKHQLRLRARGATREAEVDVDQGGWAVVSLMALR
ncbi:MAG TPA: hypothetical protein VGM06_20445 [Polyangiaceae bacterium]